MTISLRFSQGLIDEINGRLNIVDLIGNSPKVMNFHSIGNGNYAGHTNPNSQSKASLKVNGNTGEWHDKATNIGGMPIHWVGYEAGYTIFRGRDFLELVHMAAERAGVELEELTDEEKGVIQEWNDLKRLLTEATETYHHNLKPEHYDYIEGKWGLRREIVDKYKIGYATEFRNLHKLDQETLKKSGLIKVYGSWTNEIFHDRITFPYWKKGEVVYFAARAIKDDIKPKYKKLMICKEKQEYISSLVQNQFFYGEDSVTGQNECVITEGVTDCLSMLQSEFPCLSPVTKEFREEDASKLIQICKKLNKVYICNDSEESNVGRDGALKTAVLLENEGIPVRIVILPRPEEVNKVDIAEYMKTHTVDDFKHLQEESVGLWEFKLSLVKIQSNASTLDRLKAFQKFITVDLEGMKQGEWEVFVKNEVAAKFELKIKDIHATISKVLKERISSKNKGNDDGGIDGNDNITFDLNSVSGRNAIYRTFADEYITKNKVKCINGKLRRYKDGIYPESDEDIDFIKTEIMKIGLSHGVNLADNNLTATLKIIENSTRVRIEDCEPDKDNVIVVNNGILNLRTWELEDFSEDKVYFSKLPVDYLPNAPKPGKFMKFIDVAFKDNQEQGLLAQELAVYTLLKNYNYQNYFYLLGSGGEGKGTYLEILRYMLGEHNVSAASLYQLSDHLNLDYHVIELYGKSANICGDAGCKKMENTETLKKLTSNTDPVRGRRVRERPIDFINYAKIIIALNRLPETNAFTLGDRRRCVIINFNNKVKLDTKEEIKALGEMIRNSGEMSGVLNWAIEGLKRLEAQQGFTDSRSIAQKNLEYERKSRPIKFFVEKCLEEAPGNIIPNAFLYERFIRFTQKNKSAELSQDEIKREIIKECAEAGWAVGNKSYRVSNLPRELLNILESLGMKYELIRCFIGIRLLDEPTPAQSKINECDLLGKKGLMLDVISFKEHHGVYKNLIKETHEFVIDMKSWYPDYTIDEISAAVDLLLANGWKLPTATTI
jgi:DNA primase catalytic core